jgi:hypothetical protein
MKLSEDDKQRIVSWLSEKCGQMRCHCCGTGKWTLADISLISLGYNIHNTRFHYHEGIPQIPIVCNNCGHIVFFSPVIIGFKPDAPEPPTQGNSTSTQDSGSKDSNQ